MSSGHGGVLAQSDCGPPIVLDLFTLPINGALVHAAFIRRTAADLRIEHVIGNTIPEDRFGEFGMQIGPQMEVSAVAQPGKADSMKTRKPITHSAKGQVLDAVLTFGAEPLNQKKLARLRKRRPGDRDGREKGNPGPRPAS